MGKILLLTDDYFSDTSANAVCIRNLVKELNRDNEIFIITEKGFETQGDKEKNHFYYIEKTFYSKIDSYFSGKKDIFNKGLFKVICGIRHIIVTPFYPNVAFVQSKNEYKLASSLIKKEGITKVIAFYRPYSTIYTALRLKDKYKNLQVIGYHLDLLTSPNNKNSMVCRFKKRRGMDSINKEIELFDKLILPESAKEIVDLSSDKIKYVGFPLYRRNKESLSNNFNYPDDCLNITYIGSLDKENRNLSYTLRILEKVYHRNKLMLHIWGKLSDVYTQELVESYDFVNYHGVVENSYTSYLLCGCDFVLNIGNKITADMVPSKIFQVFSTGMPIINVVREKNDKSLVYFEKYDNSVNINEYIEDFENDVERLGKYISSEHTQKINDEAFLTSTPIYICSLL